MKPLSFRFRHMLISVCLLCAGIVCITEQSTAQGFTNVAPGVGITTTFGNVTYGGGVSCADFNEDGFDDLTLTTGTGSEVAFYINDSTGGFNGPFNYITNTYEKKQPLWVDYDNDGDLDFYVTTNNTNRLYRNDGNYVLTDVTASCGISEGVSNSFNSVWFDYDEDGFLDLVMSHRFSFLVGNLSLYHNLGDGTFEDLTIAAGLNNMGNSVLAMATLDYDNDGWEDLFVAQDFEVACLLLHNNGDGTFTNTAVSAGAAILNDSMTCTVGDFDNNGYMDVYLTDTAQNGNSLLVNQGDGTFVDMAEEKGVFVDLFTWGASFLDADCDMDLDLHINRTSGSPYSGLMYENLNQGEVFQLVSATWGFGSETGKGNGNAVGDYDNDGYPDLAKNNTLNTPGALWRNDFSENNFLKVKLTGTVSNRMAIGSVIHLYAGGVHQMRRVGCGEGFSSQHSYTQLFGLGENETADSIMVSWTNGMLTILYDVQANQLLELIENPLAGCMDEAACNYDPQVITDGENCIYAQPYYDCFFQCIADTDDDDVCDELEVAGCTDNAACNYNPLASDEDNSCEYASCFGCTDSNANNYDPTALFDNGTCTFVCVTYTFILSTDCWSSETSWVVYNPFGDVAYSSDEFEMDDLQNNIYELCLATNCNYVFYLYDSYGDGLNGSATGCAIDGNYQMNDNAGNIVFQMGEPDFDTEIAHNMCVINYGCMDETACNYDSLAQMEATCFFADNYFDCEGNCLNDADGDTVCDELETEGCTDENACNFDANASDDNGSCSYIFDYLIVGEMNVEVGEIETYTYEETVGSIYNWTIDGGVILSGQGTAQITVQWTLPGTGLLSVVETNASACIGELVGVTLNISPIGVFELHESQLSVFPNPAHQHIIIDLGTMQTTSLYLFDAAGRMVCKAENVSADLYTMPLNVAAGVYALCAMSGGRWRMTVLVVE